MHRTVLVVEDDPAHMAAIERAVLRCCDAKVIQAPNAEWAMAVVSSDAGREFAAVFLDLRLPGAPGTEVVRLVRRSASFVPVVMLTQSSEEADLYAAYKSGANAYVVKAHDLRQFEDDVEATARFWLQINRLPKP